MAHLILGRLNQDTIFVDVNRTYDILKLDIRTKRDSHATNSGLNRQ